MPPHRVLLLMDSHCKEQTARILGIVGVTMEFHMRCSDYKKIYYVVVFGIVVGSEVASLCVCWCAYKVS